MWNAHHGDAHGAYHNHPSNGGGNHHINPNNSNAQIESLRQYNGQGVVEVQANVLYEVTAHINMYQVAQGGHLNAHHGSSAVISRPVTLRIFLPENFPHAAPNVSITPHTLRHRLIDGQHCIVYPKLTSQWTPSHSLGRVVAEVFQIFTSEAPVDTAVSSSSSSSSSPSPSHTHMASPSQHQLPAAASSNETYSLPTNFAELASMTTDDLQRMMDNEEFFDEQYIDLKEIKQLKETEDALHQDNERLARDNLSKEPIITQKRQHLQQLHATLTMKLDLYNTTYAAYQGLTDQYTADTLLALLKIAASDVEDESEKIVQDYLGGGENMTSSEFVKKFMDSRTRFHTRAAKVDRLQASNHH